MSINNDWLEIVIFVNVFFTCSNIIIFAWPKVDENFIGSLPATQGLKFP